MKTLKIAGEIKTDINNLKVEVLLNQEDKTITIRDNGIGMTDKELDKYINQIAFSGAEEFVNKYKDADKKNSIIGHFGLGFYSAFMVADRVELVSRSWHEDSKAWQWSSDGGGQYEIIPVDYKKRGTRVTVFLKDDSKEFCSEWRIESVIKK